MILVLMGTNPYNFSRLAKAADEYAKLSGKDVFIQLGNTNDYIPIYARYRRFLNKEELLKKIQDADLIISQGGFGSISDCLLAGKKVIAVPRKPELGEAPDRQEELVRELEKLGRVIGVYEIEDLTKAIEDAESKDFQKGQKTIIPELINQFLKEHDG